MKTVFLFPGQGSQYPGMCRDIYDSSAGVRELFDLASDLVGKNMTQLLFEGTEDELKETLNTQVAVTLANLSAAKALQERGWVPEVCAGFSLGEFAALTLAGVLTVETVFPLVKVRGEIMSRAVQALDRSAGDPGMAAVMGLSPQAVRGSVALLGRDDVFCANFNSPVQTVISGTALGLKAAEEALKTNGAKRVIPLKVSGPFHSPLLVQASRDFRDVLRGVSFSDPRIVLFSNVTGGIVDNGLVAKELAAQQLISPVKWTDVEQGIASLGALTLLETGPGTVLTGLWKAQYPEPPCHPAGKREDIDNLPHENLKGG